MCHQEDKKASKSRWNLSKDDDTCITDLPLEYTCLEMAGQGFKTFGKGQNFGNRAKVEVYIDIACIPMQIWNEMLKRRS